MTRLLVKIMFWLSLPWLFLIAMFSFTYARLTKNEPPTFLALSTTMDWVLPICTILSIYLIANTILALISIFG